MSTQRRSYSAEFKLEALGLLETSGRSAARGERWCQSLGRPTLWRNLRAARLHCAPTASESTGLAC